MTMMTPAEEAAYAALLEAAVQLTTGRRFLTIACPQCRIHNAVISRVGDELVCGVCGAHFWHGNRGARS